MTTQTPCNCCDGECNHDACCGKIEENCATNCSCHTPTPRGWEGKQKRRDDRLYRIFGNIKTRCNNKNFSDYKNYGGRGIKCFWDSFNDFDGDMRKEYEKHVKEYGEKNTEIDRIDNDGNYCKENCRWVTRYENSINKRGALDTFDYRNCSKCVEVHALHEENNSYVWLMEQTGKSSAYVYYHLIDHRRNKPYGDRQRRLKRQEALVEVRK